MGDELTWLRERLDAAQKVCEAAKAEVAAQGYRSSDMARALKALYGEFWYEEYVEPMPPVCGYSVVVEMDDGPLELWCIRGQHAPEQSHRMARSYDRSELARTVREG